MDHDITFGKRLQRLRKENGLSQESLSEKLSITRQTISKWELDQSTPEIEYIAQLSDIFEVSTDYLIKGSDFISSKNVNSVFPDENEKPISENAVKKACFSLPTMLFSIGIVLLLIGASGILVFIVLSAQHPWIHYAENGKAYTGLIGFLYGNNMMRYFLLFCISSGLGTIFAVYPLITHIVKKWTR